MAIITCARCGFSAQVVRTGKNKSSITRGRIAPRGAARAQGPRSAARRVPLSGCAASSRQPLAAASAESEGPKSPIIRRERAACFGGESVHD